MSVEAANLVVELRILRERNEANSRIAAMGSTRAAF